LISVMHTIAFHTIYFVNKNKKRNKCPSLYAEKLVFFNSNYYKTLLHEVFLDFIS